MNATYRTPNAFFVSTTGQRLQKQLKSFFSTVDIQNAPAVLIGPVFPFLATFDQNHPNIVLEREILIENDLFSLPSLTTAIDIAFIAALNDSVTENLPSLIKETSRFLKPQGRLFLLYKNKKHLTTLNINNMPDIDYRSFSNEFSQNGLSIQKKKSFLYFPYKGSFFEKADFVFSFFPIMNGAFSLIHAQKNPLVTASIENYNSTRMTSASVLTSPRT